MGRQRYQAVVFSIFAGLALLLTAVGIYGLVANSVAQRSREMSIRIALGARASDLLAGVVTPGLLVAAAGVVAGLLVSWYATTLLQGLIWGIAPRDATSYVSATLLMLATALVATILPALRVLRLDPAETLHQE